MELENMRKENQGLAMQLTELQLRQKEVEDALINEFDQKMVTEP